ncbi:MAG: hypothetical protein ACR2KB_06575 [Chitinophagaceae bacterium]
MSTVETYNPLFDLNNLSEKNENLKAILQTLSDCKKELQKCGIYLNENLTTNDEEFSRYLGL